MELKDSPEIRASIVVPVYNEQENLPELLRRLVGAVRQLEGRCELIFVDDGSTDKSVEVLRDFQTPYADVIVVELARNFGQHPAIMAGFTQCKGKVVVTLDADLQNQPEEIPRLVEKVEEGYDVVGTVRKDRQDPWVRKAASKVVNLVVARATGHNLHDYGCMLRAYSRETVQAMLECGERHTFIPALAMTVARRATELEVDHAPRNKGQSKYDLFKLLKLNLDLMLGFTAIPLRLVSWIGFSVAVLGLIFSLYMLIRRLVVGPEVEGVFTLFAILFFFIGVQIMALGLVGEYLARIYDEVRQRPRYIIRSITTKEAESE